jgi:hypothetical protein
MKCGGYAIKVRQLVDMYRKMKYVSIAGGSMPVSGGFSRNRAKIISA